MSLPPLDPEGGYGWQAGPRAKVSTARVVRPPTPARTRTPRRPRRLLLTLLVLGVAGGIAGFGTYSAFTSTTSNTGNSYAAGTVTIADNDSGGFVSSLSNAKPGDTDSGCIRVSYTGSLAATVRLYGSTTGSLPTYLTLTVTRGTDSAPSFRSCTNFTADATNYVGAGAGVIYSGSLSAFPASYAAGIVDPTSGSPATWTNGTNRSYKFAITLQDDNNAQGLSGTATFTWEARNT